MIKHLAIQIALVLAVTSQFSSVAAHQTKFDGKVTADVFQEVVSELRSSIQHDVSTTQDLITKLDQVATQPSAADDIRRRLLSAEEGVTTSSLEIVNQGWQLILNAKDVLDAQRLKVQELLTSILGDRWTVFVPYTWLAEKFNFDALSNFEIKSNLQDLLTNEQITNLQRPENLGQLYNRFEIIANAFCEEAEYEQSMKKPTICEGPTITITYQPKTCIINPVNKQIICDPAKLVLHKRPAECTLSHYSSFMWQGKQCRHKIEIGQKKEKVIGGGTYDVNIGTFIDDKIQDFHALIKPAAPRQVIVSPVPNQIFQRRITWDPAKFAHVEGLHSYVVSCSTDPELAANIRTIKVLHTEREVIIGNAPFGENRALAPGEKYSCGVAGVNIKGVGAFYNARSFYVDPMPAAAPTTYSISTTSWSTSSLTTGGGASSYKMHCVPIPNGDSVAPCNVNGARAVTGPINAFPPQNSAGAFKTLTNLAAGIPYSCYLISYGDENGFFPSSGVCSSPVTVTTPALPIPAATFVLGPLGAPQGQVGQNGWFTAEESLSGSPLVPGQVVTNLAAFAGANSWKIGGCSTRCGAVNFAMQPGFASNNPAGSTTGWTTSGWAGKPSSSAPADRARSSLWIRSLSTAAPIIPNGNIDATNFPTPTLTFSLEGKGTERISSFGVRVVGTDLKAICTGILPDGTSESVLSDPLQLGAWYQLVTTAEFIDGQFNDRVIYQLFNSAGDLLLETTLNSWEQLFTDLVAVRRFNARNQLGKLWVNEEGGFFVDNVEVSTWNSADPNTLLYQYSTGFESAQ